MEALFSVRGRMGRLAYFGFGALILFIGFAALVILGVLESGRGQGEEELMRSMETASLLFALMLLWPCAALTAKRLHDLGFGGWHAGWIAALGVVSLFVPATHSLLGLAVALVLLGIVLGLLFAPGQAGANAYGPPPGAEEA